MKSFVVLACALVAPAQAQESAAFRAMNQRVEPFRIAGDIHYVGASDVTSFLITTSSGHILLDGGFAETAGQIADNIRALGFRVEDVRILLNSHAHTDHAGGLAELKRMTGARLLASARDAPLLERGGRDDPQFGNRFTFPPVGVDSVLADGAIVALGGVRLQLHLTPGHTPGCSTWSMSVVEDDQEHDVLFLCSVSAPGYRLVDNDAYPTVARDFERSFDVLEALRCDVFLGAHGFMFSLADKIRRRGAGDSPNPFIDPEGCRAHLTAARQRFEAMLREQQGAGAPR